MRADLHRHAPRDFAHGREQRQPATFVGHGFIGEGDAAAGQKRLGQRRLGRQMQIGEQDLPLADQRELGRLRLLDLEDQLGLLPHRGGGGGDLRPGGDITGIANADAGTRAGLDQELMPMVRKLAHYRGHGGDAIFVGLALLRYADQHEPSPSRLRDLSNARRLWVCR